MANQQPKSNKGFKEIFFNILPVPALIGVVLGAIGGWVYYIEIGCMSGTCPLTSNPYLSILWGALIGYLVGDLFRKKKPAASNEKQDQPS